MTIDLVAQCPPNQNPAAKISILDEGMLVNYTELIQRVRQHIDIAALA